MPADKPTDRLDRHQKEVRRTSRAKYLSTTKAETRPNRHVEAHHIHHFARDGGATDLDIGILFCKHHHLLLHNNGWEIEHQPGGGYWLIPPPELDPDQTTIELVSKSPILRDLKREHALAS